MQKMLINREHLTVCIQKLRTINFDQFISSVAMHLLAITGTLLLGQLLETLIK